MTENTYTTTELEKDTTADSLSEPMFYVVSPKKFTILFLTTLGMYSMYWFYKNWNLYRAHTTEKIWPVPRAVFSIFFIHSLFRHIHTQIVSTQRSIKFNPQSSATLLVGLIIISNLLDRIAGKSIGSPITDILSLAMLAPLLGQFLKAQAVINLACDDEDGSDNSTFTTANYIWITIGLAFWGLYIFGMVAG